MLKILQNTLFSTRLMALLFLVMATAMAFGTFVESWYSTETARIWIYNAWWFEAIMAFFMINFIGNISRYRLLRREKWPVLMLHLSWILIILGAFITRYLSYEGMMPIREGATENVFYSDKTFLTVLIDGEIDGQPRRKALEDDLIVTEEGLQSNLPWTTDFNGIPVKVSYVDFIKGARIGVIQEAEGALYLKLVEAGGFDRAFDRHQMRAIGQHIHRHARVSQEARTQSLLDLAPDFAAAAARHPHIADQGHGDHAVRRNEHDFKRDILFAKYVHRHRIAGAQDIGINHGGGENDLPHGRADNRINRACGNRLRCDTAGHSSSDDAKRHAVDRCPCLRGLYGHRRVSTACRFF